MTDHQTLEQLKQLRLQGMYQTYKHILAQPTAVQPNAQDTVALLADAELMHKTNSKTERLRAHSKLRYKALLSQVYTSEERNLSKQQLAYIGTTAYLTKTENIIITGATGCGKTYLACAIGYQACTHGYSTYYLNLNDFADQVALSKIQGTYTKYIALLSKKALLILDEFGIAPLTHDAKIALLQICESRYQLNSTIIIGQIPVSSWHTYINEPTLADAILDRITANTFRIELQGKSLRAKKEH